MPIYDVVGVSFGVIPTCVLTVKDGEGRIYELAVKGDTDLSALEGKRIRLATTNREIIPHDIVVDEWTVAKEKLTVPEPPTYTEDKPKPRMEVRNPQIKTRGAPEPGPGSGVEVISAAQAKEMGIDKLIEERRRKQAEAKLKEKAEGEAPKG